MHKVREDFIVVVHVVVVGAVKIYVTAVEALRGKGKKRGWNSVYHQMCWKKTIVWVPVISLCKILFPVTHLMPEEALREKGRQDETQFITKCVGKTIVWVPVISLCKILFPVTHLMPYYAKTGYSQLHIWCPIMPKLVTGTLQITLLGKHQL